MSQWHLVHLYGPGVWHWVHRIFGPLWGPNVTVCLDIPEGITFLSWKIDKMSRNVSIILLRNMYASWICRLFFYLCCVHIFTSEYCYFHRWALASFLMLAIYPTFDNDICYSDIGEKHVGLKTVILILEVFRYWHQSPFQGSEGGIFSQDKWSLAPQSY